MKIDSCKCVALCIINKHGFNTCPNNLVKRLKSNCPFFVLDLFSINCQKTIYSIHLSLVIDYADIIYCTAASTSLHKLDVLYHSMLHCIYKCSIFRSSQMTLFHGKLVFIRQFLGISIYQWRNLEESPTMHSIFITFLSPTNVFQIPRHTIQCFPLAHKLLIHRKIPFLTANLYCSTPTYLLLLKVVLKFTSCFNSAN